MQPQADAEPQAVGGLVFRIAAILWPSFLTACALQMLVFGWIDPGDLHDNALGLQDWPPQAIQSLAFLVFWALAGVGTAFSAALLRTPRI